MLFADQTIVLLVQVVAVVLHVLQCVWLLPVVVLRSYVVIQLRSVFFLVFVTHLFELLLPKSSIFTFVENLLLL
jgi:hypothetical protein